MLPATGLNAARSYVPRAGIETGLMLEEPHHGERVDTWLARCVTARSTAQCVETFEQAFGALCARTRVTLGDVTVTAITDRVLLDASEEFPAFAALRLEPNGAIDCTELGKLVGDGSSAELIGGVRYLLVEFLTLVGRLTAEVLTPALHAELERLAVAAPDAEGPTAPADREDEDASS
jgi:hypothetical protein